MRLEITRKTDLALRALRFLDGEGRVPRTVLAAQAGTTPGFLARVMGPLVREGLVESKPGTAGGYTLRANTCAVSVLDLIELMEGPVVNDRCVLRGGPCADEGQCSLHAAWSNSREALMKELAATTVADCN